MDDPTEPLVGLDCVKATWLVLKILAVAGGLFVLLRLVAPNLMNTHNDILFWLGVLCWPGAVLILIWAGVWVLRDIRALRPRAAILPPTRRRPGSKGNPT